MSTTKPAKIFNDADALRALPGLILSLLFVALAYWSWGKWTDAHIDFGNELYIAWRLAEGADLYVDIAHRNGPLSHYVNALLFSLFGASLRTLVFCNLAIFAGICALVFAILRAPFGRAGATLACSFLLIGFGFSQYTTIANFNYITPYQHYQTHGLALGLLMILALVRIHALQQLSQSNLRRLTGWSAIANTAERPGSTL